MGGAGSPRPLVAPPNARTQLVPTGCVRADFQGRVARMRSAMTEAISMVLALSVTRTRWTSSAATAAAFALAVLGIVLIGQGTWIYAKAMLAQVLLDRAFAQTVASGHTVKPWFWADTWPVARIEVPRIGQSAIVLAGASGQALAFGPGHVERTPEAGERGTAIYSAHRDTHFAFLRSVVIGDEIRVTRGDGAQFRYRVTHNSIVRWDASGVDPLADGHHLVLATCWPLDAKFSGPLRYLVHAELLGRI
jgi:sortase A